MARPGGLTRSQLDALEVGSKVLIASENNVGRTTVLHNAVVTRVTKTQIVVYLRIGGGYEERYRREDGVEVGRQSTWSAHAASQLMDPHSEHTVALLAEQRARNRRETVRGAFYAWEKDQTSPELAAKLHTAVGEQLDFLRESTPTQG